MPGAGAAATHTRSPLYLSALHCPAGENCLLTQLPAAATQAGVNLLHCPAISGFQQLQSHSVWKLSDRRPGSLQCNDVTPPCGREVICTALVYCCAATALWARPAQVTHTLVLDTTITVTRFINKENRKKII